MIECGCAKIESSGILNSLRLLLACHVTVIMFANALSSDTKMIVWYNVIRIHKSFLFLSLI